MHRLNSNNGFFEGQKDSYDYGAIRRSKTLRNAQCGILPYREESEAAHEQQQEYDGDRTSHHNSGRGGQFQESVITVPLSEDGRRVQTPVVQQGGNLAAIFQFWQQMPNRGGQQLSLRRYARQPQQTFDAEPIIDVKKDRFEGRGAIVGFTFPIDSLHDDAQRNTINSENARGPNMRQLQTVTPTGMTVGINSQSDARRRFSQPAIGGLLSLKTEVMELATPAPLKQGVLRPASCVKTGELDDGLRETANPPDSMLLLKRKQMSTILPDISATTTGGNGAFLATDFSKPMGGNVQSPSNGLVDTLDHSEAGTFKITENSKPVTLPDDSEAIIVSDIVSDADTTTIIDPEEDMDSGSATQNDEDEQHPYYIDTYTRHSMNHSKKKHWKEGFSALGANDKNFERRLTLMGTLLRGLTNIPPPTNVPSYAEGTAGKNTAIAEIADSNDTTSCSNMIAQNILGGALGAKPSNISHGKWESDQRSRGSIIASLTAVIRREFERESDIFKRIFSRVPPQSNTAEDTHPESPSNNGLNAPRNTPERINEHILSAERWQCGYPATGKLVDGSFRREQKQELDIMYSLHFRSPSASRYSRFKYRT